MSSSANLIDHKEKVLITGGTGLVGLQLSRLLAEQGHTVMHLSRSARSGPYKSYQWDINNNHIDEEAIQQASVIIHLAGAGVADKRWSEQWKKEIYDSRINAARLLVNKVKELNPDLKQFISASAIGYYGLDTEEKWMDEEAHLGEGFLAEVVRDWEKEALEMEKLDIPTALVRIGIVLSKNGGALQKMMQPVKLGAGAPLGSGRQYMSWIHSGDLVALFHYLMQHRLSGIFNGVAPDPVSNATFTKELARQLDKPLFLPNVPSFVLKIMVGEMAGVLTGGNRVSAQKALDAGFNFTYPTLSKALQELLK